MPIELIPDGGVNPDDEAVYETLEDSLIAPYLRANVRRSILFRIRGDSFFSGMKGYASFIRANFLADGKEACLILEKDKGEKSPADFIGGGFSYNWKQWRITAGDFLAHFGTGLILTTPYSRSGLNLSGSAEKKKSLPNSAQENRNLRGIRVDWVSQKWSVVALGSYSPRDARLNPFGTVERLNFSGIHNDSASCAERKQVAQGLGGMLLCYSGLNVHTGISLQGIRFNRIFAPKDSTASFFGQNLAGLSFYCRYGSENKTGELELAHSFPGNGAGMVRFKLNESGINALFTGTVYQKRFFSPAGRRYALTNNKERVELRGTLGYHKGALKLALTGNTYRDYSVDSIPARLEIKTGYESRVLAIKLVLNRTYRLEQSRTRAAKVVISTNWDLIQLQFLFCDEYPEWTIGRGRAVSLNAEVDRNWGKLALGIGWIDISGKGVRVSIPESGPMQIGTSFSSYQSALRLSVCGTLRVIRLRQFAAKLGLTRKDHWQTDIGLQWQFIS
ncbi:MAG: hypothetical protein ABIK39_00920 [candidate division WOR-3 bacterium]